jgi:hypothetical protein
MTENLRPEDEARHDDSVEGHTLRKVRDTGEVRDDHDDDDSVEGHAVNYRPVDNQSGPNNAR